MTRDQILSNILEKSRTFAVFPYHVNNEENLRRWLSYDLEATASTYKQAVACCRVLLFLGAESRITSAEYITGEIDIVQWALGSEDLITVLVNRLALCLTALEGTQEVEEN